MGSIELRILFIKVRVVFLMQLWQVQIDLYHIHQSNRYFLAQWDDLLITAYNMGSIILIKSEEQNTTVQFHSKVKMAR